jgi:hypothetical protein
LGLGRAKSAPDPPRCHAYQQWLTTQGFSSSSSPPFFSSYFYYTNNTNFLPLSSKSQLLLTNSTQKFHFYAVLGFIELGEKELVKREREERRLISPAWLQ